MSQMLVPELMIRAPVSPMVLSDRLLSLAQAADRAGLPDTAERLLTLALSVFDETPVREH
jgi:hypothetical protein